ncbi:hypothetical protein [Bacillus sp. JJ722]|uniref:hypothetical protein n=1 Tax=Bacillus sp. JJ722 TaxID=3122973 RepID=UPI0030005EDE
MKYKDEIEIVGIKISGYVLQVPPKLSEFLNSSDIWKYEKGSSNKENPNLENYNKKISFENGQLKTYLTFKGNSAKSSVKAVS